MKTRIQAVKQFEYKMHLIRASTQVDDEKLVRELTELGLKGWEVVSCSRKDNFDWKYLMMREIKVIAEIEEVMPKKNLLQEFKKKVS